MQLNEAVKLLDLLKSAAAADRRGIKCYLHAKRLKGPCNVVKRGICRSKVCPCVTVVIVH